MMRDWIIAVAASTCMAFVGAASARTLNGVVLMFEPYYTADVDGDGVPDGLLVDMLE